jgi:hypothetical protein
MAPELGRLAAKYTVATAVAAFVAQPVPVLDEVLVPPMQYGFAAAFIKRRGGRVWRAPWLGVSAIIAGGVGARIVSRFTLGFLPPAGAIANAITAAATTVLLAQYLDKKLGEPS